MALKLDIPQPEILKPKITIFGVGGAGGNAINNMIRASLEGVDFVAANTDAQSLANSLAQNKIQLGALTTKGLGAGSFPDRGRAAAEENISEIEGFLEGNNMVFIAAGMGGGTGTGAAPVIAKLAKERDILTVGVVTKPFQFEGKYRMEAAEKGIEELKKHVDTLIVIPNQNLFRIANEHTTFESAFKMADDVLHAGVRGITDLITMPGLVNLDFADIRTIMTKMGKAMMGTGEAEGENRAIEACEAAISNPLLDDVSIKGAKGVLVNMTGGPDMTLFEADLAVNTIKREVDANANIIFGSAFNEDMKGRIRISVVATGIDEEEYKHDILKTSESFEASKFRVNLAKPEIKKPVSHSHHETVSHSPERKSFFDPGKPAEPVHKEFEEVRVDFKAKKYSPKEESFDYSASEIHVTKKSHEKHEEIIHPRNSSGHNFFADDSDAYDNYPPKHKNEEEDFSDFGDDDGFEDLSSQKPAKPPVVAPKQIKAQPKQPTSSGGGFSLFNFMNKKTSDTAPRGRKVIEDFEDEYKIEKELPEPKAQKKPHRISEERVQEAMKKKQEFFGATVFDDDKNSENEVPMDDDVLSVPAFFRRKK